MEEVYAIWRAIAAPVLWVAARRSRDIPTLARAPAAMRRAEDRRGASRTCRNGRLVTIADAGHMLHHDQPDAVARAVEAFLRT